MGNAHARWSRVECCGDTPPGMWGHSSVVYKQWLYVFGGRREKNDLYILDLETKVWRKAHCEGIIPPHCRFHSAITIGNRMIVFGGEGVFFNEIVDLGTVYVLDLDTLMWTRIHCKGDIPSPRSSHTAVLASYRNNHNHGSKSKSKHKSAADHHHNELVQRILLFGGEDCKGVTFNDVFELDPDSFVWRAVKCGGVAVPPMSRHTAVFDQKSRAMVIVGGTTDAHEYKTHAEGDSASHERGRKRNKSNNNNNSSSSSNSNVADEMINHYQLDLESFEWHKVRPKNTPPKARWNHSCILRGSTMLIFGGSAITEKELNELYEFDLASNKWRKLEAPRQSSPIKLQFHTAVLSDEKMFVFGGLDSHLDSSCELYQCEVILDSMWDTDPKEIELELDPATGEEQLYAENVLTRTYKSYWKGESVLAHILINQHIPDNDISAWMQYVSECNMLRILKHESIVNIKCASITPPRICMVTDFAESCTLNDILEESTIEISWEQRLSMLRNVVEALRVLHGLSILMINLSASNLLVDADFRIKVSEVGFAKLLCGLTRVTSSSVSTTEDGCHHQMQPWLQDIPITDLLYLAPEVLQNWSGRQQTTIGPASDIYSFGMVMWNLLMRRPLEAPSFAANWSDICDHVVKNAQRPEYPHYSRRAGGQKMNKEERRWRKKFTKLMSSCWEQDAAKRPNIETVSVKLREIEQLWREHNLPLEVTMTSLPRSSHITAFPSLALDLSKLTNNTEMPGSLYGDVEASARTADTTMSGTTNSSRSMSSISSSSHNMMFNRRKKKMGLLKRSRPPALIDTISNARSNEAAMNDPLQSSCSTLFALANVSLQAIPDVSKQPKERAASTSTTTVSTPRTTAATTTTTSSSPKNSPRRSSITLLKWNSFARSDTTTEATPSTRSIGSASEDASTDTLATVRSHHSARQNNTTTTTSVSSCDNTPRTAERKRSTSPTNGEIGPRDVNTLLVALDKESKRDQLPQTRVVVGILSSDIITTPRGASAMNIDTKVSTTTPTITTTTTTAATTLSEPIAGDALKLSSSAPTEQQQQTPQHDVTNSNNDDDDNSNKSPATTTTTATSPPATKTSSSPPALAASPPLAVAAAAAGAGTGTGAAQQQQQQQQQQHVSAATSPTTIATMAIPPVFQKYAEAVNQSTDVLYSPRSARRKALNDGSAELLQQAQTNRIAMMHQQQQTFDNGVAEKSSAVAILNAPGPDVAPRSPLTSRYGKARANALWSPSSLGGGTETNAAAAAATTTTTTAATTTSSSASGSSTVVLSGGGGGD